MTFHDIRFPTRDEWGGSGGPGGSDAVLTMDSGQERIVSRWSANRRQYDVAWQVKEYDLIAEVLAFYHARERLQHSFRFKDWLDYNTTELGHNWEGDASPHTATDQTIGVGDGTTTTFQLVKRYEDDAGSHVRNLTKIVADSTLVSLDDVPTASGWTVNLVTGVVTFSSPPADGEIVKAGCEFDVEVRFGDSASEFFAASADNFGSGSIPSLPLIEKMGGEIVNEDRCYGGAKYLTFAADITVDMSAALWVMLPTGSTRKATLPPLAGLPKGGPIFTFVNIAPATSVDVRDSADGVVDTLVGTGTMEVYHGVDAAGASKWYVTQVVP